MHLLRRGLVLVGTALTLAAAGLGSGACASTPAPREVVAVHASVQAGCAPDAECVTVAGNPCSPCAACPNAPTTHMTRAEYARLTASPTCESTHPKKEQSKCIPCES